MKILYETPYSCALKCGYPLNTAFACYVPDDSMTTEQVVSLAGDLLGYEDLVVAVLRPYGRKQYLAPLNQAAQLLDASAAEAYSLLPGDDGLVAQETVAQSELNDEAAIVRLFPNRCMLFFHDGHRGFEMLGPRKEVNRCLAQLWSHLEVDEVSG